MKTPILHHLSIPVIIALTTLYKLLVWRQEGHPAGKTNGCWFVGGDDLTGALHVLQL